jgi:hypothetical protein
MKIDERAALMFDFLAGRPDGCTILDLAADQQVSIKRTNQIMRRLRMILGDGDEINVVCEPDADRPNGKWRYYLVGNLGDARGYIGNRSEDIETRLRTLRAVVASQVNATDARTIDGRKARLIYRQFSRLIEDLDDVSVE